ncbi:MAG: TIGR01777 family protein [Chitinophagaceae bacterium]|nr:TIGR01777 family protein [Chitinophagaceae bacterium]
MGTVIITGGTGLVGKALTKLLIEKGWQVIVLTRKIPAGSNHPKITYALWNVKEKTIDIAALQKADYIIHLAGAGVVDKRWSNEYKKEIRDSRTQSSALIIDALKKNDNKVKTIVSASATGWYGADMESVTAKGFIESAPPAPDFLGETCRLWEESIDAAVAIGKRVVKLRTGIVLSNEGGALAEFKKPLRFGIASILGNGKQMVSWIHIDDLCRMYAEALQNPALNGAYNAIAPNPVSNKILTLELAKIARGKFFIPMHVPAFVLKIMLGESSIEVLKSCTASCEKIRQAGFTFLYPSIEAALLQLCKH